MYFHSIHHKDVQILSPDSNVSYSYDITQKEAFVYFGAK
jgi:hypothetical protein